MADINATTADASGAETGTQTSMERATGAFAALLSGENQDTGTEPQKAQRRAAPKAAAEEPEDEELPTEEAAAEGEEGDETGEDDGSESTEEGDEESDEGESADDQNDEDPVYTVTVDGEEVEVPLSELAKGYSRTADYTRKTQALAAEREAFHGEVQEARVARDYYARGLQQLSAALQAIEPQEPNWDELKARDPIGFAAEWADHQRRLQLKANLQREQQMVNEQAEREAARVRKANAESGRQWLLQQIPEWKDPAKVQADRTAIEGYGRKLGYQPEELKAIDDPRAVLVLRKAMLYDKAMAKRAEITSTPRPVQKDKPQAPAAKAPVVQRAPVLKPGMAKANSKATRQVTEYTRAKQAHAKVGSVKTAASVFEKMLSS